MHSESTESMQLKFDLLYEENRKLVEEIRNLRCAMVEAAASINPSSEPVLFAQLSGQPNHFITSDYNPYPEHDDYVSEQYTNFLSNICQKNGY